METGHGLGCGSRIFAYYPRTFSPLPSNRHEFAFSSSPTGSHHLTISIFTTLLFHVHGSGVSRPETPDTVFFRTPLPVQSYFPNEGISLASKCQRLVYLFIENMKYFLACILPGTMDKKMSKIYFLTRKTRLIEM